ncbi:MAG: hypothetical protein NZM43_13815, partial [Saprospiraceae bacterium]|nr:hypothetical protein [Saprospiraceae bacterium]MDW8485392.1 hypothetical protein [Saprospiraceae bacterium]
EQEALVTSAGAGDAGKIPALDTNGKLHVSLLPTGFGTPTYTGTAGEALAAGDFVYIESNGNVRKADASAANAAKAAVGFVLSAVANGASATVYLEGNNDARSSLTVGALYFLSASSPGGVTTTAPTTAGHLVQALGRAINSTTIAFDPDIIAIRG